MSVADMEPTPNFHPISPEELMDTFEAMKKLHTYYAGAKEKDKMLEEQSSSPLLHDVKLEIRPYLMFGVAGGRDALMPCNYYQMLLKPDSGTRARKNVSEIVARFPYFAEADRPFRLPKGAEEWNDVSLELKYTDGTTGCYWLNGKMLTPYRDADAIDYDYDRRLDETDLYVVKTGMEDTDARPLTGTMLFVWLRESTVMTQSNNPDEQ